MFQIDPLLTVGETCAIICLDLSLHIYKMRIVILIFNYSENWQNPEHFEGTYIFVEGLSNRNITIIFNKIIYMYKYF